ncbi:ferrochelatase [Pseudonocardia eucalypti]|uniref:Coproporphyrin III ferrochelatase n=1 Tax=Pseudonocardia eucalypti TaxID=648755 RepID=A0ABP9R9T6_9PSEU|nr:ferrochelatase [Pseudonocardia eucalypti]
MVASTRSGSDYQALLVLSFGGPEGPDDVLPFLERVTAGRGVPRERLLEVAKHYDHFGGVSPINARNRELIARVERELAAAGLDLPVYFGNRNWHPLVEDTVARMAADGVRRALVLATSAYGGYSACRQYHEDIARARASVGEGAPELVKLRQFFDHPEFVGSVADATRAAAGSLPDGYRLVFTAHSIPSAADAAAGPPAEGGHRYSRQVAEAARLVAAQVGAPDYDVVWQSRSGPPSVPWLEPDVLDHLDELHGKALPGVLVCPVGFVSDHVEVVWDLDNEARERAAEHGMAFARAAAAGEDDRFARMVVELVREHTEHAPARSLGQVPSAGCTANGAPCAPDCCLPARPRR